MIRIRFHGRGGHGVKTASRIVGTAAFLDGQQVQDSPIYGAERRGAAVTSFTRIDSQPILERGVIARADLIIVGDETLLRDGAAVLASQESASAVFLNVPEASVTPSWAAEHGITAPVVGLDVTARSLAQLGRASALSAGLAAAAARLTGVISLESLRAAVRQELQELDVSPEMIARNERLAVEVFESLAPIQFRPRRDRPPEQLAEVDYEGPLFGTPSILDGGNAALQHTGAWRVERPVIDTDVCTRCGLCVVRCPDGAIALDEHGFPVIDYDHCKGCLICRHECPVLAIGHEQETRAW